MIHRSRADMRMAQTQGDWLQALTSFPGEASWSRGYFKLLLGTLLACLYAFLPLSQAQPSVQELPMMVQTALGTPRLSGQGEMRFWGWRIYDARLWVGDGFNADHYADFPSALDLSYHRAFSGADIARRSVQEIERQGELSAEQRQAWENALTQWLPDVQAGDRLLGVYIPNYGMRLWRGDHAMGWIKDPELARRFLGIWLAPQTSELSLRWSLLGQPPEAVR